MNLPLIVRRWGRRLRAMLPNTPHYMKPERTFVEPIVGETRGEHYDYCAAVRGKSRYAYAPDHYVFNGGGFHRRKR